MQGGHYEPDQAALVSITYPCRALESIGKGRTLNELFGPKNDARLPKSPLTHCPTCFSFLSLQTAL